MYLRNNVEDLDQMSPKEHVDFAIRPCHKVVIGTCLALHELLFNDMSTLLVSLCHLPDKGRKDAEE